MPERPARAKLVIVSDGHGNSTNVFLEIDDGDSHVRYKVPGVSHVTVDVAARKQTTAVISVTGCAVEVVAELRSDEASVRDVLAQIAAGRLANEPQRFVGEQVDIVVNMPAGDPDSFAMEAAESLYNEVQKRLKQ